jgi:MoaE-MoaD fusion protein
MRIKVLYFATLRDRAGRKEEWFELPEGSRLLDLHHSLSADRPELTESLETALFAVNKDFAFPEQALKDGDEVAIFPPVSGGSGPPTALFITEEALDLDELLASITRPTTGAACVFSGMVRGLTGGEQARHTDHLEYEAYLPMAQEKLRQVADEIRRQWPAVEGIAIVQRLGSLEPGTPTVVIACTAAHRDSGVFEAARYGIDRLKEIVPIWKKEVGPRGEAWVEGDYHPGVDDRR